MRIEMKNESPARVVVAANFTIELIGDSLQRVLAKTAQGTELVFAPYNQIFQQLLDPDSLFHSNLKGANVVFIRLEDLVETRGTNEDFLKSQLERIGAVASDLADSLGAAERFGVPLFLFLCPPSAGIHADPELASEFKAIEQTLSERVSKIANLHVFGTGHVVSRYDLGPIDNPKGNVLGHIPYNSAFISALGVETVRKIDALQRNPFKVLVLDCDNTLWDGVVGEDGFEGIGLSEKRLFLQEFAVAQSESGMVVCLNSKNNEQDVWEVFDKRNDMVLKKDHIVASRINWLPKSQNLRSIAEELQLGLDSFVFVDDDPAVCSEVERNCPQVLTVLLPESNDFSRFFEHLWAFDRLKITQEDRDRTGSYKSQALRRELQAKAGDMAEFHKSLGLVCEISELTDGDVPRASQLTLRTNQFNSTTRRYSEAEIRQLASEDAKDIWTVRVRDRFGDYGLVGVVISEELEETLAVRSVILSCRVLGRGVEYEILKRLGKKALAAGLETVTIEFRPTAKNAPILSFLTEFGEAYEDPETGQTTFSIQTIAALECSPRTDRSQESVGRRVETAKLAEVSEMVSDSRRFPQYVAIANELSRNGLAAFGTNPARLSRDELRSEFRAAQTEVERELIRIWERILMVEGIGTADNFFEIGGDSMLAVNLFVEIEERFGKSLPLYHLIDSPTIEKLARRIEANECPGNLKYLVPIRAEGSRPTLFCFHAAGGNVLNYIELANALDDEQPVYGLQMRGVTDKSETAHDRVEDMAEEYLKEIRSFQPSGPYRFLGASFGGLVAFEAARQLCQVGESVDILAMVDTYAPGYVMLNAVKTGVRKRISDFLGKITFKSYYLRQLPTWRERFGHTIGRIRGVALRKVRQARWRRNAIAIQFNKATGKELPKDMLRNVKAIRKAEASYFPLPCARNIILFRATFRPKHINFDEFLGWRRFVEGEIVIEDVRGNHNSVMAYPFVGEFAAVLNKHLCQVEKPETAAASA
jgi:FkbH-like protein